MYIMALYAPRIIFILILLIIVGFRAYLGSTNPVENLEIKLPSWRVIELKNKLYKCKYDTCNDKLPLDIMILCANIPAQNKQQVIDHPFTKFWNAFEALNNSISIRDSWRQFQEKLVLSVKPCIGKRFLIKNTPECSSSTILSSITGQVGDVTPTYLLYLCYYERELKDIERVLFLSSEYSDKIKDLQKKEKTSKTKQIENAQKKVEQAKTNLEKYLNEYIMDVLGDKRMDINPLILKAVRKRYDSETRVGKNILDEIGDKISVISKGIQYIVLDDDVDDDETPSESPGMLIFQFF
ncbi:hypothetical protein RF11_02144 [Thelohanellus kitauei]|uniref:Uncharacterized protein n=1 Tax=Thelohanellus kitauei TaxID=669202 RepID=A0A0C2I630_THEKT|nr:hypothetical protein RF11_02144 [Thelohanellus kitauei]